MFNKCFENRVVYEIMWEKYCRTRQATDGNTVICTRFARYIIKLRTYIQDILQLSFLHYKIVYYTIGTLSVSLNARSAVKVTIL
jgi:hypothetical protein